MEIQQTVKNDFLANLTHDELKKLVKGLGVRIEGFSKRPDDAPLPILKQSFKKKINKIKRLDKFLQVFSKPLSDELENEPFETGIKKIAANNMLSHAEVIALIAVLYPENYLDLRQQFKNNFTSETNLLTNMIDFSLVDTIEPIIAKHLVTAKKAYDLMTFDRMPRDIQDLKDILYVDYDLDHKVATSLIFSANEINLSQEESLQLAKLSTVELLKSYMDFNEKIALLNREKEDLLQEKDKYFDEIKKLTEKVQLLENNIKNKDKLNYYLKKAKEMLENDVQQLQNKLASLQETSISKPLLSEHAPIILYTSRKNEFKNYLHNNLLKDLNEFNSQSIKNQNHEQIFIDVNGIPSKTKKVMSQHKQDNMIHLISGDPEKIIRTIIFYLEGASIDEIN